MTRTFYHATPEFNKESIMNLGLIPKIGKLSIDYGEEVEAIYLFNSLSQLDDALSNWFGEEMEEKYGEDICLSTFEITLPISYPGLVVKTEEEHYESICTQRISSEYISYYRED